MPEKPLCDVKTLASLSAEERAERLFSNRFKIVGNLSEWEAQNRTLYAEAREVAQTAGRVGESAEQRGERHRREATIHHAEDDSAGPSEVELADAIQAFPRERCRELFVTDTTGAATRLHKEHPEEYRRAKLAGQFFDIVGRDSSAQSVRFNYPLPTHAKLETPTTETPAGIAKAADGIGFVVTDAKAYGEWQALQAAKKIIASAK